MAAPALSKCNFLEDDSRSLNRAAESLSCLPFRRAFYDSISQTPISSLSLAMHSGHKQFCFDRLKPDRIESHFRWLIRLGVLRREVDGQGLTERVRLTPMAERVLQRWSGEIPRAGISSHFKHWVRRYRPRF